MKPIIEVNGLWKEYRRGAQKKQYLSLRDQLFSNLKPKNRTEAFWALQDINFNIEQGDSMAIIGKNGAGKSTLLKILSRITPPTKGEIILRGRLASLLEVGTGFHPELTGRENIYLNGSILGLGRNEINHQFDAIVDFSGVEAFLNTPLKHYSSGMQLRLAFAVAAHLEPEILVIDEVLAVGDSAFQQKCINKMTEVSQSGRTLLFVSHNITAISKLCSKAILLDSGTLNIQSDTPTVIKQYQTIQNTHNSPTKKLNSVQRNFGKQEIQFSWAQSNSWIVNIGESFEITLGLESIVNKTFKDLMIGIAIRDIYNQTLIHASNLFLDALIAKHEDTNCYHFRFPEIPLKPGTYTVVLFLKANEEIQDWLTSHLTMQVKEGNRYNFPNSGLISGLIQPEFSFETTVSNQFE